MKRTKGVPQRASQLNLVGLLGSQSAQLTAQERVDLFGSLMNRARLAGKLGMQYGADRDVYEALGYPTLLEYDDYNARYWRQDMAKAIIDRPVEATWRGEVTLVETPSSNGTESKLQKAWKELVERLDLKDACIRLDKVSQIGRWGVLLLGFADVSKEGDFANELPADGQVDLAYVKPFGEGNAAIKSWEENPNNPRYGLPKVYNISIYNSETKEGRTVAVHYSRILHVAPGLLESEYEGTPTLRPVFNRLMDLEKLTGGSAEMFWRGARPGYQLVVEPDFTLTQEVKDALQEEWNEYENKLRRVMQLQGAELKALQGQVETPKDHVDVIIQMISASTGIPKRILTGSERGELASSEDKGSWLELIEYRRTEFAAPRIILPFVSMCQGHGVLPQLAKGKRCAVKWEDLWSPSDKQQAEVGRMRAEAIRAYGQAPLAPSLMPPKLFLKYCMGFDDEEVAKVEAELEEMIREEEREIGRVPPMGEEEQGAGAGKGEEGEEE